MLGLSPIRLLIIVVVALIVLGPDKLPHFARQAGAAWKSLRSLQERVETELRDVVPDLPSTSEIARYARSPVSLLNRLADHVSADDEVGDATGAEPGEPPAEVPQPGAAFRAPDLPSPETAPDRPTVTWGDPTLN